MRAAIFIVASLSLGACTEQERRTAEMRAAAGGYPLRVLVDRQTGCQYLSAWEKGLTPRVSRPGQHICSPLEPSTDG